MDKENPDVIFYCRIFFFACIAATAGLQAWLYLKISVSPNEGEVKVEPEKPPFGMTDPAGPKPSQIMTNREYDLAEWKKWAMQTGSDHDVLNYQCHFVGH